MKLRGSTLCADRNVPELRKLGVVVELGDLEFAYQFRRWIHVAERAVLTNVHGGRAIDGILDLRWKGAAHRNVAVGILLRAGNSGQHSQRARGRSAIIYGQTRYLLETF